MLVFGDATQRETVACKLDRLRTMLAQAQGSPLGIERHARLVAALIEAGELAQGIADAHFHANGGHDAPSQDVDAAMAIALMLARLCAHSWHSGLRGALPSRMPSIEGWAAHLPAMDIEVRQPEGYAFYALYPECYLAAACQLGAGPWRVIGLRSIGTSLAAIAAAALGDPRPVTLRPVGHPFGRRVAWRAAPRTEPSLHHAIVDEGPGLSGSSMAAVIRLLREEEGVAPQRIHLFTAHARGPGAEASPQVRALWAQATSHAADFDAVILHAAEPAHRLQTWVEACVGSLRAPLRAIDGGGWRQAHRMAEASWPPVHPWQERRKFLAEAESGTWLVKFAGLGHRAEERIACAEALARAGFCPEVAGACHGFLIERWHGGMTPLSQERLHEPALRTRLLARTADYLAFRARTLAMPQSGASLRALCDMGRHNTVEALGTGSDAPWERHLAAAARLQARVRPVRTDSRLQPWEWLDDGVRLLKTDAIDHHAGHDLIGCQDVAWDVAGARTEYALGDDEIGELLQAMAARGRPVDAALIDVYSVAYPAFQLGHASLASRDTADAADRERLERRLRQLTGALQARLAQPPR
ncbi:hypothetical protein [Variovorax sp. W2I14]|uniref:hypothetical protein n=1 Tax=Variovorax sp. W2I14 TaxID=3042290 RepID=UPI003D1D8D9E